MQEEPILQPGWAKAMDLEYFVIWMFAYVLFCLYLVLICDGMTRATVSMSLQDLCFSVEAIGQELFAWVNDCYQALIFSNFSK